MINYKTPLFHTALSPVGVHQLESGVYVAVLPALDTDKTIFARHSYADAMSFAISVGGRLGSVDEHRELRREGLFITPTTLWPCDMMSLDTYRRHDSIVWTKLGKAQWNGESPVVNCGKQWLSGAKKGRALNFGWFTDDGIIQDVGTRHDDQHYDYSQTTTVFFDDYPEASF